MIFNNFLNSETYKKLKDYSLNCEFTDIVNPIDGVIYPDIDIEIPTDIRYEILSKLSKIFKAKITQELMFMRMSKEGTHCPHIHHTDNSHGEYSLMLYLNTNRDAGTSLVRHIETGIMYAPASEYFVDLVSRDINNLTKWVPYDGCEMKENTAMVFDAGLFHRAEPIGGFGNDQSSARIVLTTFFSLER